MSISSNLISLLLAYQRNCKSILTSKFMKLSFGGWAAAVSLAFLIVTLSTNQVFADSKFSATYDVTYEVKTSGITEITQNISLKNLTADFYATEYSLNIGATKIS